MSAKDTLWSIRARCHMTFMLLLLAAALWPGSVEAATASASKDCPFATCTINPAIATPIVIVGTPKILHWEANYTGSSTQGHSFYLTTNPNANQADIALTTSGQGSGTKVLTAGTYYISIKVFLMGPGSYSVTYNSSSTGEPHITTTNGARYDFQAAGEFTFLRDAGLEIQVRHSPIATKPNPTGAPAPCVSINSAVAARVGRHRVTYEPVLSGVPDPGGLQLRVDGVLAELGGRGIDLGGRSRITRTNVSGGLRIDFPDGTSLIVTPGWWAAQSKWYLNFDIAPAAEPVGIGGAIGPDTWLPALPDGSSMGPLPATTHDRYVGLNQKFADAWRVTDANSLFDYGSGTSTSTFTNRSWPPERPPCDVPGTTAAEPIAEDLAKAACQAVRGGENANCVYDVMVTGNPGFAATYALSQSLPADTVCESTESRWIWILLGLLLGVLIALLICLLRRKRARP